MKTKLAHRRSDLFDLLLRVRASVPEVRDQAIRIDHFNLQHIGSLNHDAAVQQFGGKDGGGNRQLRVATPRRQPRFFL